MTTFVRHFLFLFILLMWNQNLGCRDNSGVFYFILFYLAWIKIKHLTPAVFVFSAHTSKYIQYFFFLIRVLKTWKNKTKYQGLNSLKLMFRFTFTYSSSFFMSGCQVRMYLKEKYQRFEHQACVNSCFNRIWQIKLYCTFSSIKLVFQYYFPEVSTFVEILLMRENNSFMN